MMAFSTCHHILCRRAISTWRATLQQSKAVASLQLQHNQRRMAAVLAVWAQAAWEQRYVATARFLPSYMCDKQQTQWWLMLL
jgi:hypothetical protein